MDNVTIVEFVGSVLIPAGLMLIMFSLGLALSFEELRHLFQKPKAVMVGLGGQLLLLPVIGFALGAFLPAPLATGLVILAACPGGVTSNAVVFAARGDIALSVSLTTISSAMTVLTTPLIISLALVVFYEGGTAPEISIPATMKTLFTLTVLPVSVGMVCKHLMGNFADRLVRWLRPTSMLVLLGVIAFSTVMSYEAVLDAATVAGPAVLLMNVLAISAGYIIAGRFRLPPQQQMTIGVEVGVQNATMATFLVLAVLDDIALSVVPGVYGLIMLISAGFFVRWHRRRQLQVVALEG